MSEIDRREFLKLAGVGGVVFASGLPGLRVLGRGGRPAGLPLPPALRRPLGLQQRVREPGLPGHAAQGHRRGERARPEARLRRLHRRPHADHRRSEGPPHAPAAVPRHGREAARARRSYYFAGEHDAALDRGEAYLEVFGGALQLHLRPQGHPLHRARQHLGSGADPGREAARVAASRPRTNSSASSRSWFSPTARSSRSTRNGTGPPATAPRRSSCSRPITNVTVFYGHIHHEHHHRTGHIGHHAAQSLMFPLSPVGTMEKKTQLPWNAATPYAGLGFRDVQARTPGGAQARPSGRSRHEGRAPRFPRGGGRRGRGGWRRAPRSPPARRVEVARQALRVRARGDQRCARHAPHAGCRPRPISSTASRCPTSASARTWHPGRPVEVTLTPGKPGRFHYLCDNFCGDGHDRMSGILVVT